jgi:DNA-binding beta-propeller fold protein YncE
MRLRTVLLSSLAAAATLLWPSPSAWAVGELAQKAGDTGCVVSPLGIGAPGAEGCGVAVALRGAKVAAASPDGKNVYVVTGATYHRGKGAVTIFDRDPATGALIPKSGEEGCISMSAIADGCAQGRALDSAIAIAVSADGRSVYVLSERPSNGVAIFDRNPVSGVLTQKEGAAGCILEPENGRRGLEGCRKGRSLAEPADIAISPDGKNVYVAVYGYEGVVVFDRDTRTGALTQKRGKAGCISPIEGCGRARALEGARGIAISPDGRNVYLTASGVTIFDRNRKTGTLRQKKGAEGCIVDPESESFSEGCQRGRGLGGAFDIAVSPNGRSVYAVGGGAVAILDRDRRTGALRQKRGGAGCIRPGGTKGCRAGRDLSGAKAIAVSPDGASVYVSYKRFARIGSNALLTFSRNLATGALTAKPGEAGCIVGTPEPETESEVAAIEGCQKGRALNGARGVIVSPDGRSVYVTSVISAGVAIFDRAP